jgi:hypothetical protein
MSEYKNKREKSHFEGNNMNKGHSAEVNKWDILRAKVFCLKLNKKIQMEG